MKVMDEFYNQIICGGKSFILLFITTLASIYVPLQEIFSMLLFSFAVNIFIGMYADVNVNKNRFNIKKFFDAVKHLGFYLFLLVFVHKAGISLNDSDISEQGVKWVTIIVLYYYITNITRNATIIFPTNKTIHFIYLVLTTQIFNKLKAFFGFKVKEDNEIKEEENSE